MPTKYVVDLRGDLYGPFPAREQAENWGTEYAREWSRAWREDVSWEIRPLRTLDGPF